MLMVDLNPTGMFLILLILSPMYFSLAQSRKLVVDPPECAVHELWAYRHHIVSRAAEQTVVEDVLREEKDFVGANLHQAIMLA